MCNIIDITQRSIKDTYHYENIFFSDDKNRMIYAGISRKFNLLYLKWRLIFSILRRFFFLPLSPTRHLPDLAIWIIWRVSSKKQEPVTLHYHLFSSPFFFCGGSVLLIFFIFCVVLWSFFFFFFFLCLVCSMVSVSLKCPFLIAPSVFANVHFPWIFFWNFGTVPTVWYYYFFHIIPYTPMWNSPAVGFRLEQKSHTL